MVESYVLAAELAQADRAHEHAFARYQARLAPSSTPSRPPPGVGAGAQRPQLMTALEADPQLAALILIRGWIAAVATPAVHQLQQGAEQAVSPWMERVLTEGQRIGAVRADLLASLLLAIAPAWAR